VRPPRRGRPEPPARRTGPGRMRRAQALVPRERRDALGRGGAAELGAKAAVLLRQLGHRLLPRLAEVADADGLDVQGGVAEQSARDRQPASRNVASSRPRRRSRSRVRCRFSTRFAGRRGAHGAARVRSASRLLRESGGVEGCGHTRVAERRASDSFSAPAASRCASGVALDSDSDGRRGRRVRTRSARARRRRTAAASGQRHTPESRRNASLTIRPRASDTR
jgi:hypothetical protein